MRLVGYTRVSTEEQAEGGPSLGAQARTIRAAVKASGDQLVEVIEDAGVSGKDCNRDGLQRALRMLTEGEADGLIAVALDRLTRNTADMAALMEWFGHHHYTLRLLDVGVDSSTAAGEVVLDVMAAVAQMIRKQTGEKTRAVLRDKKSRGLPISRPAAPSPIVERVQSLYADGLGFTAIARQKACRRRAVVRGRPRRSKALSGCVSPLDASAPCYPSRRDASARRPRHDRVALHHRRRTRPCAMASATAGPPT
jgi:DNA invertase Pin-like site-specific DNA recombinase